MRRPILSKIDLTTNEVVWQQAVYEDDQYHDIPTDGSTLIGYADDNYVYLIIQTFDDDTKTSVTVTRVDASTGEQDWSKTILQGNIDISSLRIKIDADGIYFCWLVTGQASVVVGGADLSDGSITWTKQISYVSPDHPEFSYWMGGFPYERGNVDHILCLGDKVYFQSQWQSNEYYPSWPSHHTTDFFVMALNKSDGTLDWKISYPQPSTLDESLTTGYLGMAFSNGTLSLSSSNFSGGKLYIVEINGYNGDLRNETMIDSQFEGYEEVLDIEIAPFGG